MKQGKDEVIIYKEEAKGDVQVKDQDTEKKNAKKILKK